MVSIWYACVMSLLLFVLFSLRDHDVPLSRIQLHLICCGSKWCCLAKARFLITTQAFACPRSTDIG